MVKNVFSLTIIILCILYFICIFLTPHTIIEVTKNSAIIWFSKVFPTLFPYFIIINILIYSKIINYISYLFFPIANKIFQVSNEGFFAFLLGALSGYPVGVKTVSNLYKENFITKDEANKLLFYVNNSGPLFIIGTVGINLLGSKKYGYLIFLSHILSSIATAIIISRIYKSPIKVLSQQKQKLNLDLGNIFFHSIVDSINSIFLVGGFITLFFNLNFVLDYVGLYPLICHTLNSMAKINLNLTKGVLYGFLEITNGVIIINQSQDITNLIKLLSNTFIISWGGLSVHFQAISFLNEARLPIKNYIIGKFLHSIIAMLVLLTLIAFASMYSSV